MTRIYRSEAQDTIEKDGKWFTVTPLNFDEMFRSEDPAAWLDAAILDAEACEAPDLEAAPLLAPIGKQEIWAAGVTYFRSRQARMEEAESAGGDVFYDNGGDTNGVAGNDVLRPCVIFNVNCGKPIAGDQITFTGTSIATNQVVAGSAVNVDTTI